MEIPDLEPVELNPSTGLITNEAPTALISSNEAPTALIASSTPSLPSDDEQFALEGARRETLKRKRKAKYDEAYKSYAEWEKDAKQRVANQPRLTLPIRVDASAVEDYGPVGAFHIETNEKIEGWTVDGLLYTLEFVVKHFATQPLTDEEVTKQAQVAYDIMKMNRRKLRNTTVRRDGANVSKPRKRKQHLFID